MVGDPKQAVYKICKILGKETTNPEEIVKLLQTVDALKLVELQREVGLADVTIRFLVL